MKKNDFKNLENKASEVLSREQLKMIVGGEVPPDDGGDGQICYHDSDCADHNISCYPWVAHGHCIVTNWLEIYGHCRYAGCPY